MSKRLEGEYSENVAYGSFSCICCSKTNIFVTNVMVTAIIVID